MLCSILPHLPHLYSRRIQMDHGLRVVKKCCDDPTAQWRNYKSGGPAKAAKHGYIPPSQRSNFTKIEV